MMCYSLLVIRYPLFVICYSLFVIRKSLFVNRKSLFVNLGVMDKNGHVFELIVSNGQKWCCLFYAFCWLD